VARSAAPLAAAKARPLALELAQRSVVTERA
jgi:hypothetical protein